MVRLTVPRVAAVMSLLATVAWSSPLQVKTLGTKSQVITMCPDCKEKITCATVGDYTIGFDADLENSKLGTATVAVHLLDKAKKPVKDAAVFVTLTMPNHKYQTSKPITLKHAGHGRYVASTHLTMTGSWRAAVEVTPASGDSVKQVFVFTR